MAYKQKGHGLPGINQRSGEGNSAAFQQRSLTTVSDSLSNDAESKHNALQTQLSKDQAVNASVAQMMVNTGSDIDEIQSGLDKDNTALQGIAQHKSDSTWTSNQEQFAPLAEGIKSSETHAGWNAQVEEFNKSEESKKNAVNKGE